METTSSARSMSSPRRWSPRRVCSFGPMATGATVPWRPDTTRAAMARRRSASEEKGDPARIGLPARSLGGFDDLLLLGGLAPSSRPGSRACSLLGVPS